MLSNVNIIEAQLAKLCTTCKNTKLKLLKVNAAIWFNKMCRIKQVNPDYILDSLILHCASIHTQNKTGLICGHTTEQFNNEVY